MTTTNTTTKTNQDMNMKNNNDPNGTLANTNIIKQEDSTIKNEFPTCNESKDNHHHNHPNTKENNNSNKKGRKFKTKPRIIHDENKERKPCNKNSKRSKRYMKESQDSSDHNNNDTSSDDDDSDDSDQPTHDMKNKKKKLNMVSNGNDNNNDNDNQNLNENKERLIEINNGFHCQCSNNMNWFYALLKYENKRCQLCQCMIPVNSYCIECYNMECGIIYCLQCFNHTNSASRNNNENKNHEIHMKESQPHNENDTLDAMTQIVSNDEKRNEEDNTIQKDDKDHTAHNTTLHPNHVSLMNDTQTTRTDEKKRKIKRNQKQIQKDYMNEELECLQHDVKCIANRTRKKRFQVKQYLNQINKNLKISKYYLNGKSRSIINLD